ncbi:hypothetical protein KY290_031210 [Solanum tuberosum]|uniref:Uncharacterized protein n=1 Tax=Solanum tuberosum TaxID=4113 RepID=A0ABQ7U8I0_SOLTU|nr:hypothetical protein KY290_031210 [Solanum tuberosum]
MSSTDNDKEGSRSIASTTHEASILEQPQLVGDQTSSQQSLPCPMLPGPQIPMTEGATGVPTPPVVPTVVHLPPVPPPGASEQDLRGANSCLLSW